MWMLCECGFTDNLDRTREVHSLKVHCFVMMCAELFVFPIQDNITILRISLQSIPIITLTVIDLDNPYMCLVVSYSWSLLSLSLSFIKDRGTATEPPPRANYASTANQVHRLLLYIIAELIYRNLYLDGDIWCLCGRSDQTGKGQR